MQEIESSQLNLGDLVALKSHPYFDNLTDIIISGEPQLISPLMVIIEILNDAKDQFDEKTGEEILKKGNAQCKCTWYSNKSYQFEESWISSKLLKVIRHNPEKQKSLDDSERKAFYGRLVLFGTADIEGEKKKSSISTESNNLNSNRDKTIINPLLSYLCPVMQITQVIEAKSEGKESLYDQKTGKSRRFVPKYLAKCKWYNHNDKFSEKLLPLECLKLVPEIALSLLESIKLRIQESKFYRFDDTIIQPHKMYTVNGSYFLKAFDYLINRTIDIDLSKGVKLIDEDILTNNEAPAFEFVSGEDLPENYFITQYSDAATSARKKNAYIRINYKSRRDEISSRTLKDYEVVTVKEGAKVVGYIRGYCMTKKAFRNFNISRIFKLQELNIKF